MARSMFKCKNMLKEYWAKAISCALYLMNRSYTKNVHEKIPQEAWSGYKPVVTHLRIFGSIAYTHIPHQKRTKLDDKSARYVFIGYDQNFKGYKLYNPSNEKIVISRVVEFDEEAQNDWKILQLDVKTAFLNSFLEEEVCVDQPPGYVVKGQEDKGYAKEILKKFEMENCMPVNTPVECRVKLSSRHDVCTEYDKGEVRVVVLDLDGICWRRLIKAHDSDVACVALSNEGRLLATASTKGTLVRVFDTWDGRLLPELTISSEIAEIHSLCFSSDAEWMAVSSNKGTIHVFRLNRGPRSIETDGSHEAEQNSSPLSCVPSFKGIVLPNNRSPESSVARFRIPKDIQHIVAFGHQKNIVLIVGMNGRFYRCKFDPIEGGEMTQMEL
ncbi:UNVERIFIED_CONTAM: Autophagy-related protein 18a [Sesamum radiatum]|uniref:Autophagy-related protein 18a n=1 Tax=Sesamum radiatum TaxID=300843 RepID=A0AAW2U8Y5_SESRA